MSFLLRKYVKPICSHRIYLCRFDLPNRGYPISDNLPDDIELQGLYKRVAGLGYSLELTDAAKDFVATKGYDIQFGARPLKRAIQKYLEDEMAEMIIRASVGEGDTIVVDFDKDKQEIVTNVKKSESAAEA